MAYDLEEQEQLDNIKELWRKYGGLVLTVLLIITAAFAAVRGWNWYQARNATQAAHLYEQLREAVVSKDASRVRDVAGRVFADYSDTAWAQMTALTAADVYLEAGDAQAARVPLQWAIDNARDPAYRDEARLRLAGILLDQRAFDEGLGLLGSPGESSYAGAFADRRGDLLVARGDAAQARQAYQEALKLLGPDSALRRLVQIKLDALGGEGA